MNLWATILIASVAIGIFLLVLLLLGRKPNRLATHLFAGILVVLVATNFDNWLYASGLWTEALRLIGFSRGSILLVGPLMYLYAKSITDPDFRLGPRHLLHTIPYSLSLAYLIPVIFFSDPEFKRQYIRLPMEPGMQLLGWMRLVFVGYLVHLAIYLGWSVRMVRREISSHQTISYIVPITDRLNWLRRFTIAILLCFIVLAIPLGYTIVFGAYHPGINFAITTLYSILIFYLGAVALRNEKLVLPDFARKYQTLTLSPEQEQKFADRVAELFQVQKIYLDPNLTLKSAADLVGTPAGYLSRHINEVHRKSFPDFVNQCRVEEVKRRMSDPRFANLTILGLAMEVGFSSKSSFNAAFKKITGQNPSDYKKSNQEPN